MNRLLNRYLKLVFTRNEQDSQYSLNLTSNEVYFRAKVSKYQSNLKDESVVEVFNLSNKYITKLKQYDTLSIYSGREDNNGDWIQHLVSIQSILSITVDKSDLASLKTIIVCSSRFRKNDIKPITIQSGKSIWEALSFICKRGSLRGNISEKLKNRVLQKPLSVSHISSTINTLIRDYPFINVANDMKGEDFDIHFDYIDSSSDRSSIIISPENRTLIKDWVQVEGNGDVSFSSLPNRISFKIGDSISIDKHYLSYHINSSGDYISNIKREKILDKAVKDVKLNSDFISFIIINLEYDLDVVGNWEVQIKARPRLSFRQRWAKGAI